MPKNDLLRAPCWARGRFPGLDRLVSTFFSRPASQWVTRRAGRSQPARGATSFPSSSAARHVPGPASESHAGNPSVVTTLQHTRLPALSRKDAKVVTCPGRQRGCAEGVVNRTCCGAAWWKKELPNRPEAAARAGEERD